MWGEDSCRESVMNSFYTPSTAAPRLPRQVPEKNSGRFFAAIDGYVAAFPKALVVLCSDDAGYQWRAIIKAWTQRQDESEGFSPEVKASLGELFEKYMEPTLYQLKLAFKTIIPMVDMQLVQTALHLLEAARVAPPPALRVLPFLEAALAPALVVGATRHLLCLHVLGRAGLAMPDPRRCADGPRRGGAVHALLCGEQAA